MIEVALLAVLTTWIAWMSYGRGLKIRSASSILVFTLVIHALADVTTNYFEDTFVSTGSIRVFAIIIIFSVFANRLRFQELNIKLYYTLSVYLVLAFFSTDPTFSLFSWIKFVIPIMSVGIGVYISSREDYTKYLYIIDIAAFIVISSISISQFLGLGDQVYGESGVYLGGGIAQITYVLGVYVVMIPLLIKSAKSRGIVFVRVTIVIAALALMVLVLRRGAILAAFAGLGVYVVLLGNIKTSIRLAAALSCLAVIAFPLYAPFVQERIEVRGLQDRGIEDELRYREVFMVLDDLSSGNAKTILIGKEPFNSAEYFKNEMYGRPLHIDYAILLHGFGIIGLSIYAFIYLYFSYILYRWRPPASLDRSLRATGLALIATQFVMGLSGSLSVQSSRAIIMVVVGYALGRAWLGVGGWGRRRIRRTIRGPQLAAAHL